MIRFVFLEEVDPAALMVHIWWTDEGARAGRVVVPASIRESFDRHEYPDPDWPMSIESAVGYGVFLSMKARVPLRIAGDISAWDKKAWGALDKQGQ